MSSSSQTVELSPHPARWSRQLAEAAAALGADYLPPGSLVWDECAGTSERFHDQIGPYCQWRTFGTEIQTRWAYARPFRGWREADGWPTIDALLGPLPDDPTHAHVPGALGTIAADSTKIPVRLHGMFDGMVSSYVFDNRFADTYDGAADYKAGRQRCKACDGTGLVDGAEGDDNDTCTACAGEGDVERPPRLKLFPTAAGPVLRPNRAAYTALHGEPLDDRNTARYRGAKWRGLTLELLRAACDAVRVGGIILIEMKDALEDQRVHSFDWLCSVVASGGRSADPDLFTPERAPRLPTRILAAHAPDAKGYRNGANREKRLDHSQLLVIERTR